MNRFNHFNTFFNIKHCRCSETKQACYHLRYKAYCLEHGYLNPEQFPDQIEKDEYDPRSHHMLLQYKNSGEFIATVRLVLCDTQDPEQKFPLEHFEVLRRMQRDKPWKVERENIGEISRFAITKSFRRRGIEERLRIHGITDDVFVQTVSGRRHMTDLTIGLFKAVVEASFYNNISHWYALMEPALIRLFHRYSINFNEVGPPIQFYGIRQPCMAVVTDVLNGIYLQNPDIWEFITDNGRYYGKDYLHNTQESFN